MIIVEINLTVWLFIILAGLKDVDGVCVCDRTNGYYGRDKYKCGVDNGGCKIAGHQLTIDGTAYYIVYNSFEIKIQSRCL